MSLNGKTENVSLWSGVESTIPNKKKKSQTIKATKPSIIVKARMKFAMP